MNMSKKDGNQGDSSDLKTSKCTSDFVVEDSSSVGNWSVRPIIREENLGQNTIGGCYDVSLPNIKKQ